MLLIFELTSLLPFVTDRGEYRNEVPVGEPRVVRVRPFSSLESLLDLIILRMVSATKARVLLVRTVLADDVEYFLSGGGKNLAIVLPSRASFAFVGLHKLCEGARVCMSGCLL